MTGVSLEAGYGKKLNFYKPLFEDQINMTVQ
jgi:hypothetical protein